LIEKKFILILDTIECQKAFLDIIADRQSLYKPNLGSFHSCTTLQNQLSFPYNARPRCTFVLLGVTLSVEWVYACDGWSVLCFGQGLQIWSTTSVDFRTHTSAV